MLIQHLRIKACIFLRGKRIDVPANGIELFGNILGAIAVSPLKEHMLDEMGNPVVQRVLITEPVLTQIPKDTDRPVGIFSVTTRSPFDNNILSNV